MSTTPKLTAAQQRILNAVQLVGERTYNERARRPIEALVAAGFVSVTWEVMHDSLRGRHTLVAVVRAL